MLLDYVKDKRINLSSLFFHIKTFVPLVFSELACVGGASSSK